MNKMEKIFDCFFENVKKRLNYRKDFTKFGEDSIRYDFFIALQEQCKIEPYLFHLEHPFPETEFVKIKIPKEKGQGQGRYDEKPEFDLRIDATKSLTKGIVAEFGFFREPITAEPDSTGSMGKILNEISRLCLLKNYKDYKEHKALLIIVTDENMIYYGKPYKDGKKKRGRQPKVLIENEIIVNEKLLSLLGVTIKKSIKQGFTKKLDEYKITPIAKRIYSRIELDPISNKEWGIWIWEIECKKN
jgi:hypothetical protein